MTGEVHYDITPESSFKSNQDWIINQMSAHDLVVYVKL